MKIKFIVHCEHNNGLCQEVDEHKNDQVNQVNPTNRRLDTSGSDEMPLTKEVVQGCRGGGVGGQCGSVMRAESQHREREDIRKVYQFVIG